MPARSFGSILDRTHFVFREQFGMDVINADLLGDDSRGSRLIAGQHGQFPDTKLAQSGQGVLRVLARHVTQHDACSQLPVKRHVRGHLIRF